MMKEKIISTASDLFLKLGFKSTTMDDIACEMCISKKTIYKFFCNKEVLIKEVTSTVHNEIHQGMDAIVEKNYNAIVENFEIRKMFKEMFQTGETSPIYQLKKHYPDIYETVMTREINECNAVFKQNIIKGIQEGLYRKEINIDTYVSFYYSLIFSIYETISSEKESKETELNALEYHIRAMATTQGIKELEKQLENLDI